MLASRIIVNTVPKSGTHILTRALDLIGLERKFLPIGSYELATEGSVPLLADVTESSPLRPALLDRLRAVETLKSGEYAGTHHYWTEAGARYLREADVCMILLVRNPYGVALSGARWMTDPRPKRDEELRTTLHAMPMRDRIRTAIFGHPLLPYSRPLLDLYRNMAQWARSLPCHVATYEGLVGTRGRGLDSHQRTELENLYKFIGADDVKIGHVASNLWGGGPGTTFAVGDAYAWRDCQNLFDDDCKQALALMDAIVRNMLYAVA